MRAIGLAAVSLQGFVDAIERGVVYGWAWNPQRPDERISVEVLHGGTPVGSVVADRFRDDLVELEIGDGRHAFEFDTVGRVPGDVETSEIEVRFAGSIVPLPRMQVRPQLRPRADGAPRPDAEVIVALRERIAGQERVIADMSNLLRGLVERFRDRAEIEPSGSGDIEALARAIEAQGRLLASLEVYLSTYGRSLRDLADALPRDGQRRAGSTAGFRAMDVFFLLLLAGAVVGIAVVYGVPW